MAQFEGVEFPDYIGQKLEAVIKYMRSDLKTFVYRIESSAELRGAFLSPLPGKKAYRIVYVLIRPSSRHGARMWAPYSEDEKVRSIEFDGHSSEQLCAMVKQFYNQKNVPAYWQKEYLASRQ